MKVLKDVLQYGRGKGVAQDFISYGGHILSTNAQVPQEHPLPLKLID